MAKKDVSDIPYLLVGIGVAAQEEVMKAADRLIEKGKSLTPEGRKKMAGQKRGLVSKGDDFSRVVARTVQRVLENTGIVTRSDMEDIDNRVDALQKKVNKPAKAAKPPAKKKVAKKKSARKKPAAKKPAKRAAGAAPPAVAAPEPAPPAATAEAVPAAPVEIRPLIERP